MQGTDYLALEGLLIDRLTGAIGGGTCRVLSEADQLNTEERQVPTPSVLVRYVGDRVEGTRMTREGGGVVITQTWAVTVMVRCSRDPQAGTAARQLAGPLLLDVLKCLQGWVPRSDYTPLVRVTGPPVLYRGVYAYCPTLWDTEVAVAAS